MVSSIITNRILCVFILFIGLLFAGCGKDQDKPENGTNKDAIESIEKETVTPDVIEEQTPVVADVTGTYSGKFDQRPTTLKITEQNGKEFKGKITINYREVINQDVSGTFDPETNTIKMKDMLHSRFRGKYSGKLSDDLTTYSGTFTMDLDGTKFNFNLKKN